MVFTGFWPYFQSVINTITTNLATDLGTVLALLLVLELIFCPMELNIIWRRGEVVKKNIKTFKFEIYRYVDQEAKIMKTESERESYDAMEKMKVTDNKNRVSNKTLNWGKCEQMRQRERERDEEEEDGNGNRQQE